MIRKRISGIPTSVSMNWLYHWTFCQIIRVCFLHSYQTHIHLACQRSQILLKTTKQQHVPFNSADHHEVQLITCMNKLIIKCHIVPPDKQNKAKFWLHNYGRRHPPYSFKLKVTEGRIFFKIRICFLSLEAASLLTFFALPFQFKLFECHPPPLIIVKILFFLRTS